MSVADFAAQFGIKLGDIPPEMQDKIVSWGFAKTRDDYELSLRSFVRGAWPYIDSAPYQSCWATDAVCEHLEAVTEGQIRRLLINQPPRTGKTKTTSVCWQAWTWAQSVITFWSGPQVRFLCASYNERLSLLNATMTRRLILSPFFQEYWGSRFSLTEDQNSQRQFDTTAGGSRVSTSVGGSLLGFGGDIVNIDDPHNTETEKLVESDADRNRVKGWWSEVSTTRLNDPKRSAIVVNMQRLHEDDLSGVILESDEDFVHLCIPMEYDTSRSYVTVKLPGKQEPWNDPRSEEGELMWPERFGPREVQRLKDGLGPYMASGRLQQMPVPKGGGIIKREWWQLWDGDEARKYDLEWDMRPNGRRDFPQCELIVASLDTSYGLKQENDFNALTIWGIFLDKAKTRRAMLMYGWAKRLPLHGEIVTALPGEAKVQFKARQQAAWGLVEWVADTCKRYRVNRMLIEDKTRGRDVAQEINRLYAREKWGVELIEPVGDKVSRGHSIVPLFTDGAIYAPQTKWSDPILTQCSLVPKSSHDDLYDTVTMFLWWAREHEILLRGEEMTAALEDQMRYIAREESVAESYGIG